MNMIIPDIAFIAASIRLLSFSIDFLLHFCQRYAIALLVLVVKLARVV
jgi:hypothetical protein